jgi:acetyl esterase
MGKYNLECFTDVKSDLILKSYSSHLFQAFLFNCSTNSLVDDRMTEETKKYIANAKYEDFVFKLLNPKMLRMIFDRQYDIKKVKDAKFDSLEFEEHLVQSDYENNHDIPVTVYIPKKRTAETPIGVFIHGGGFFLGSRKSHHATVCFIAEATDTIWVSVEYRLSPEHKYPAALHDCCSVMQWVIDKKHKLLGSSVTAKVGIYGDSAGGCLAALVAHRFREKLAFQILIYPLLDLTLSSVLYDEFCGPIYVDREDLLRCFSDYFVEPIARTLPTVSPAFQTDLSNLPKTMIILAELDGMAEEGRIYFEKLQAAGIPSEVHMIKGVLHGFFFFYGPKMNAFKEAMSFVIEFMRNL